ncbi:MAG TPA: HAD family hydrolase [Nitrososphaerales archaeon]|nr:HAD family hydrolase [Nitrososphaerales archaeon]
MTKAIFLDRDGVINEMVYYPEHGFVDSPFTSSQFALVDDIGKALRSFQELGYKLIVISNQPGIAKGRFSKATFDKVRKKMNSLLEEESVRLDAEYYCFHHPQARVPKYRVDCECRKPKPGMLVRAAKDHAISLDDSVMVGDGLTDVLAGRSAGCTTVLLANMNAFLAKLMEERGAEPTYVARNLAELTDIVKRMNDESEQP